MSKRKSKKKKNAYRWKARPPLVADELGRHMYVTEESQVKLANLWFGVCGKMELNGFGMVRHLSETALEWYDVFPFSGQAHGGGVTSDPTIMGKIIDDVAVSGGNVAELCLFWHFHPSGMGAFWSTTDVDACEDEVEWTSAEVFNVVMSGIRASARVDRPFRQGETPLSYETTSCSNGHYDKEKKKYVWNNKRTVTETEKIHSRSITISFPLEETDEYRQICEARVTYPSRYPSGGYGGWTRTPGEQDSRGAVPDGSGLSQLALPAPAEIDLGADGWPVRCPNCQSDGAVIDLDGGTLVWLCAGCDTVVFEDGITTLHLDQLGEDAPPGRTVIADAANGVIVCPGCRRRSYDPFAGWCWQCGYTNPAGRR